MDANRRLRRLLGGAGALLAAGLGYALWLRLTGLYIPCLFWRATGFLCPGCGVTRLCLALLRGDLPAAWSANPVLLLLLPAIAVLAVRMAARYVREGHTTGPAWESTLIWTMIALLIVWGIVRNLI